MGTLVNRMAIKKVRKNINIPFDEFWKLYDYKKGCKELVEKKWGKLANRDRIAVMKYLPAYKDSTPNKEFRKHPMTFLNNKSWNDEIVKKPTYATALTSPKWQKKRFEIMQRDEFTCQLCGDTETELHVHHKYYISGRNPWEYEDKELITLCANCHKKIS